MLPDGYNQIFTLYVFDPSGFWTLAPLRYATKFDPFLSLDWPPRPPPWRIQGKEEIKFCHLATLRLIDSGRRCLPALQNQKCIRFLSLRSSIAAATAAISPSPSSASLFLDAFRNGTASVPGIVLFSRPEHRGMYNSQLTCGSSLIKNYTDAPKCWLLVARTHISGQSLQ